MKIRVTEIEATAAELRACNTLGDGVVNILRDLFNYSRADDEVDGVTDINVGDTEEDEDK